MAGKSTTTHDPVSGTDPQDGFDVVETAPARGHVDRIVADASGLEPATNAVVARTTTTVTLKLNGAIECTTSESLDRSEGVSA